MTVYNFEVEQFHTYFVGEQGLLVHNSSDVYGAVQDVVERVPDELKVLHRCFEFADDLQAGLKAAGINGQRLDIQVGKGVSVYSNSLGTLGDRGIGHSAIQVGDMVFDNLRPGGIPYEQFVADLGGRAFFDSGFARMVSIAF